MCSHTFVYHSVVPPTHCPICGACLGCGAARPPLHPAPYVPVRPWPQPQPWYGPNTVPVTPYYPGSPYYTTMNATA